MKPGVRPLALLLATLFVAAAAAGCLGPDQEDREEEDGDDQDPFNGGFEPRPPSSELDLVLEAPDSAWAGENVTFDASGSSSTDAQILSWTFDLGDGTTVELSGDEEPVVDHTYAAGGAYQVNLTVQAQSGGGEAEGDEADGNGTDENGTASGGSADDGKTISETTSHLVVVHERFLVEETELEAGLSSGASEEHDFTVQEGGSNFTVRLDAESTGLLTDAEGTLRVLDADDEVLAEEAFSLGSDDTLTLDGSLNGTGGHVLEVELDSGELTYEGTIEITYSAGDESAEEDASDEEEDEE